jgi:acetoin:2,6-dichlorophenolindophenol oxidoreductase subunit alpha
MPTQELFIELYRSLYTTRLFEQKCFQYYRQGLIVGYFHPYLGEEAIAAGVCAALRSDDYIVSTHRGHGHCVARGGDLKRMFAEIFGRTDGYCKGRGGSMHIADIDTGNMGANGIVGGGIPLGVGAALGVHIRGGDQVAVIFFSDGAANNGIFGESLNLAAIWNLPVVFVLENNQYAVSTPIEQSSRVSDLHQRADGYGVPSSMIDGNDVLVVYESAEKAVAQCRAGEGPVLIEAKTYRHGGHHVNDAGAYMPKDVMEQYKQRDPIGIGRQYLLEQAGMSEVDVDELEQKITRQVDDAATFATNSPQPSVEEYLEEVSCL